MSFQTPRFLKSVLGFAAGVLVALVFAKLSGENPFHIAGILGRSAFGSAYDFGVTLSYAVPLLFTGLSVYIGLQAGLLNVGAEGQMTVGALAATATGILLPSLSAPFSWVLSGLAAMTVAGFWGVIAGWLKAKRGAHEVITAIMLNFIAYALCSWFTLNVFKNGESQNPETLEIGASYFLPIFGSGQGLKFSPAFLIALALPFIFSFWLNSTRSGYELRVSGKSPGASRVSGISSVKQIVLGMFLSGACAGLVSLQEILTVSHRFLPGFLGGFGFLGLAVALAANRSMLGLVFSAFGFAAIHKGAMDLDLESEKLTRDFALVMQALVMICVSVGPLGAAFLSRRSSKR